MEHVLPRGGGDDKGPELTGLRVILRDNRGARLCAPGHWVIDSSVQNLRVSRDQLRRSSLAN